VTQVLRRRRPAAGAGFAAVLFAGLAVAVFVDGRLSMALLSFHAGTHEFHVPSLLDAYARFDSDWYHSIATRGYYYDGPDKQSSVAFFPGYPAVVRVVGTVVGSYVVAGVVVTFAAGLGVAVLFHRWVRSFLGERTARLALAMLLAYPFAFYLFGMVYSDALFLVAVLGAFVLLERDRPLLAGLVGIVATGARPVGVALCIGLFVRMLELRGVLPRSRPASMSPVSTSRRPLPPIADPRGARVPLLPRRIDWPSLRAVRVVDLGVVLSVLGLVGFCLLLWVRFDEPLAFTKVGGAEGWWKGTGLDELAKVHLFRLLGSYGLNIVTFWLVVQGLFSLVALGLVPAVVRRFGWGYGSYLFVVVGIAFCMTRDFIGMGRYVLAAFPAFAAAADLLVSRSAGAMGGLRRWLPSAVVAVEGALLAWMVSLSARWYFLS
jgi:hypothetical protein